MFQKMITITARKALGRNRKFFRQAVKYKKKRDAKSEKALKKTISDIILDETEYVAPNPAESILPEGVLSKEAVALFNTQVYEIVKSNACVDFEDWRKSDACLTFDEEKDHALAEVYMNMFKLAIAAKDILTEESALKKNIQTAESAIERIDGENFEVKEKLSVLEQSLARKKSLGPRKKNTSGLESEIMKMQEKAISLASNRDSHYRMKKKNEAELGSIEIKKETFHNYFRLRIADAAGETGLSELEAAVRSSIKGKQIDSLDPEIEEYLEEKFREQIAQGVDYTLEHSKGGYLPRKKLLFAAGAAVVGAAVLVAALGGFFGGTRSPSQQVIDDYQRFRRGQLTTADLNKRYKEGTPEFGYLLQNMVKDGYLKAGSRISLNGCEFELLGEIPPKRPRNITVVDNPDDLNREFRRYGRGQAPTRIEPTSTTSQGMRRDGTRYKPVRDPSEKARAKERSEKEKRDTQLEMATTEGKGVEVYKYGDGAEFNIDMGNWWTKIKHEENESPERIIMYCKKDGSTDETPATVLEMIVDEEKEMVTPIIPENMEEGLYLLVLDIEDVAGHSTKCNYVMNIRRQEGDTYMGVRFRGGQSIPSIVPPPKKEAATATSSMVYAVERSKMGGSVGFLYLHEEEGKKTWKTVNHEKVDEGGNMITLNPIFPPGTPAGEYIVKSQTEYEDGSCAEMFFRAAVDEKGRTSLVESFVPEPGFKK